MPTYTYKCPDCNNTIEDLRSVDDRNDLTVCDKCNSVMEKMLDFPAVHPDRDDFSTENGGRGRYNKQLKCYVKSVNHSIDIAKRKGMYVLDR